MARKGEETLGLLFLGGLLLLGVYLYKHVLFSPGIGDDQRTPKPKPTTTAPNPATAVH